MDMRNWKRVLQLWISEFDYTNKNSSNLEQSEVEEFFEHVRQHHEQVLDLKLTQFLKEYYGAFQPNLDDQNELSAADYAYVYSLLLHFTCVKYPTAYFQEKCRNLPNTAQEAVALFFKLMLACTNENKENLRHIIGEVALSIQQKLSPQHLSDSSGTPSPAKTPLSKSSARSSPNTPKTVLLDERTRELHSLKAQLENERYEKSLLENQIKDNEYKIRKLTQDCKRLQEKVLDMKNDYSSDAEGSSSPVDEKEPNEQQRRFVKELNQKEKEICQLTDKIGRLCTDKTTLKDKLSQAEAHINLCMTRIQEADCKIFELTAELDKKNANIKYLNEHKNELERYIGEIRATGGSARPDFNNSSDFLDNSFARANTSFSTASTSPENLATSVIDVQLREKTNEVNQLRAELTELRDKNQRLVHHIQEYAHAHAHNFNVTLDNLLLQQPPELADPLEYFLSFAVGLKELNKLYMDDLQNMRTLQENSHKLCQKNAMLTQQLAEVEKQLEANKDRVDMLENVHSELLHERQEMEDKLVICATEIENLNATKSMLDVQLQELAQDLAVEQRNSSEQLNAKYLQLSKERETNAQLQQELTGLRIKLQETQEKLVMRAKEHKKETDLLNERIAKMQQDYEMHCVTETLLKEKHEKLIIQTESLKKTARDTDVHLENMRCCLRDKELEMQKLGIEISALRQHNLELEQRLNDLTANYKQKQQKTQQTCDKLQQELNEKNAALLKQSEDLQLVSAKLEAYNTLLIAPLLEKKEQSLTLQEAVCRLRALLSDKQQIEHKEQKYQEQCADLQKQLETLEKQSLQEVEQHKHAMEAAMQQVEQLQADQKHLRQVEQDLKLVIEKHNEAQLKLQDADHMYICALEQQAELKMQLQQIQDEHLALTEKLQIEKELQAESQQLVKDLQAELDHKENLQTELEQQLVEKQQLIHDLKQDLKQQQPMQEELQQILAEKRQLQMQLQEELVFKQQQLEELQAKENSNLFRIEKLQQEHAMQLHQHNELQMHWQADIAHWQHKVDKYKCQFDMMQTEKLSVVRALEQSLDDKLVRYEQLQQEHKLLQDAHKQLEQQLEAKQQDLAVAQRSQQLDDQREAEYQRVLEQMRRDLEQQQSLMERNDAALLNILATLENAANLAAECEAAEDNLFTISKMENSHAHLHQLKRALNRLLHKISLLQQDVSIKEQQKQELETALEKNKTQFEQDSNKRTKELKEQLSNSEKDLQQMEQQLTAAQKRADDVEVSLKQLEERLQQQSLENKQLQERLQQQLAENKQLHEHLDTQKELKQHLEQQVNELARLNANLEKKQISLTEVLDECLCMKQKAESKCEELEVREKTLSSECEKAQAQLSVASEKMQYLEEQQKTSEERLVKLQNENSKLKETQEAQTKRIEKLALKLGDAQARGNKLERELNKTLESQQTGLEAMIREKEQLENEAKALKERLTRSERVQEQLADRISSLETTNNNLLQTQRVLQNMETELKNKTNKLEKQRESSEEKLRLLEANLSSSENEIVRLKLEVGALNSELEKNLNDLKHYEQLQAEQQAEQEAMQEQLKKSQLAADMQRKELEQLQQQLLELRAEKCALEDEQLIIKRKLQAAEQLNIELTEKRNEQLAVQQSLFKQLEEQFEQKVAKCAHLEQKLSEHCGNCLELEALLSEQRKKCLEMQQLFKEHEQNNSNYEQLNLRLNTCEQLLEKEQEINAQVRTDNQILQAKYAEAKQRLQDEHQKSEERIKENRLELEGKLEKMKNKMKTLYSEEISKIKSKQEREAAAYKTQIDELKAQNAKYEEHTSKLSAQILRLNDNMLENQRQHALMATKLKKLQEPPEDMRFKRPNSMHVSTTAQNTKANENATRSNMASNLTMEDEEGEVFNNTYLADLKAGRMSDMMSRNSICPEELQYRNSMLPPHLQSTYAAQYDQGLAEDELKDAQHMLDDSMSGLLTGGGVRKKIAGATHYKRPGPPTPSKNGGRLSLGGCSEPPREILKEYNGNTSSKTPSRFSFFGSRFSMGKDEKAIEEENLCKSVRIRNLQKQQKAAKIIRNKHSVVVCTSTPRKSKSHYDQRRQLEQMLKTATPDIKAEPAETQIKVEPNSYIETPVSMFEQQIAPKTVKRVAAAQRRRWQKRRISRRWRADTSSLSSSTDMKTPADAVASSELQTNRRRGRRRRHARTSMHLCGNMFNNMRTPTRVLLRDFNRIKAHKQRMERFNKMREIVSSDTPNSNAKTPAQDNEQAACLVTTQDLLAFDKQLDLIAKEVQWPDADFDNNGNSLKFEQLLQQTESDAPFEVQRIKFNVPNEQNSSNSSLSTISKNSRSREQPTLSLAHALTVTNEPTTSNLSRTIYGGSVIFNRRLPHVSSTLVRKSSIYIKNNNATTMHENDIILVTDQTITIADLARMWRQMNTTARITICFATLASLGTIIVLIKNIIM